MISQYTGVLLQLYTRFFKNKERVFLNKKQVFKNKERVLHVLVVPVIVAIQRYTSSSYSTLNASLLFLLYVSFIFLYFSLSSFVYFLQEFFLYIAIKNFF